MLLSHRIEQILFHEGTLTVSRLSQKLGVSRERCMEELQWLTWFGVEVDASDRVLWYEDDTAHAA